VDEYTRLKYRQMVVCIPQMALMARGLTGRSGVIVVCPVSVVVGIEPGHAPIHPPTTPGVTVSAVPPKSGHAPQRLPDVLVRQCIFYIKTCPPIILYDIMEDIAMCY
jgi:hypothetical protein